MKNIIPLITIILFANMSQAQSNDYTIQWKEVANFDSQSLPKSALEVVSKIAVLAKKDKNKPQQIKALLYKSKYALLLEENAQLKIVEEFKTEISISKGPTKSILQNMLATMYWHYFQSNRYQFYNRTNTSEKVDASDYRTWDLQTLFDEIHLYYNRSLANTTDLQKIKTTDFEAILNSKENSETYRPTLFDILSHNALLFYKTSENSINNPSYKFTINDSRLIGTAQQFAKQKLISKDSNSLQLKALQLYQNLIQFHDKNNNAKALATIDIERLLFVKHHAVFDHTEEALLYTLKETSKTLEAKPVAGLYDYEIAVLYHLQGQSYQDETNENDRWKIKDADELCNTIIKRFPNSEAAKKAKALKSRLCQYSLQIIAEEVLPIMDFSRVLVTYKNLNQLNFKTYLVNNKTLDDFNELYRDNEKLDFIKKLSINQQWNATLKNEHDFQSHSTEIIVPKHKNGNYIMVATADNGDTTFAVHTMQVTNMAIVDKSSNTKQIYQVIDRRTGKPKSNINVGLKYKINNNNTYKTKVLITNQYGEISLSKTKNYFSNLSLTLKSTSDTAYFDDYYSNRYYKPSAYRSQYKAFLFTDRSIYRPGQTVFFKGIVLKTGNTTSNVTANELITISLYNVNGEKIKSHTLKTNEFGSVANEFMLPNTGLTGRYSIRIEAKNKNINANTSISVEEYKRPKFKTNFNPITQTFKINDTITINGFAKAFAGSLISDAKVVYRVQRRVQYPYWYSTYYNSEAQEITHGETTTDAKGAFSIDFKAIPDASVAKTSLPIFNYEITAEVTDINGETRSATTIVNVGYHSMTASIGINTSISKDKKDNTLHIYTQNLNGAFAPAKGNIKIYKLAAPNAVLRSRPWNAPDYQVIPKEEFSSKFPHEAFKNEDKSKNWEKGTLVFNQDFDTSTSKEIELKNIKKWKSGQYIAILESKDKFGQQIKAEAKTTVFSTKDKSLSDNRLFKISLNKNSYTIEDKLLVTLATAAEDLVVTLDIEKDKKTIKTYIIKLDNSKKTISIPIDKEDLGGFTIHYSFAVFNSFKSGVLPINIPYPSTDLKIETLTFRDKLQPGEDETWSFKIKGAKGEKISAELLASMYDASLDEFSSHYWGFNPIYRPTYYSNSRRNAGRSFGTQQLNIGNYNNHYINYNTQQYSTLNWFGLYIGNSNRNRDRMKSRRMAPVAMSMAMDDNMELEESVVSEISDVESDMSAGAAGGYLEKKDIASVKDTTITTASKKQNFDNIKIRKNLQENAFFFPQLQTDTEGNISFSFTSPEALTRWNLQLLAHTKTLESSTLSLSTVTQKELMVIPNAPRFLREGDEITISTKIANLSEKALSGEAKLILTDAITGKDISLLLVKKSGSITCPFTVNAAGNTQVSWILAIPSEIQAVQYKIVAKAGDYSDGEQNALPVLSNRMLVTETMPMWIRSNQKKTFTLDKLKSNTSTTLKHHKLSLEMTSNPAWYAVQALPYLMEYPYECNEQTFSRYYANALASHIANSNPRIRAVFDQWASTNALQSNLEKNQELKSLLIQETPWLRDAESEAEQKKRIALLFNLNKMNNELQSAMRKLQSNQMHNGGWAWFKGGKANRYITQHIISGFGHLKQLNVYSDDTSTMIKKAISYLDTAFIQEYNDLTKYDDDINLKNDHLSYTQLHYLYMRSFFSDIKLSKEAERISAYYHTQIKKYWKKRSLYAKGMMALIVHRKQDQKTANSILKSLKENSITNDELGMYWKENTNSWYWHQAPIETQALLIEAFSEIDNDTNTIDNLKIWLLKNKQTNRWKTTKATTEAVYALLLQGSDWLSVTDMVDVVIGKTPITPTQLENVKIEAGTGYYKTSWSGSDIKPDMATIALSKKGNGIAWGALYWQYFEDLDKITTAKTPLQLKKKLFLKSNTDKGEQLSEITTSTSLKVGDLIRVRIELRADRTMEFVHMKDMRAAGLEPINVISNYKWQDGLGYYQSTKDAATNFFFDYLPKGIYVFEYDLRVNNAGKMSNGITTIQSMYAPEFSSHSEGTRILVE